MTCSLERSKKWKWKNSTETRRMRVRATSITGGTLNRAPEDGLQDVKKLTSWTASNSSFLSKQTIDEPGMTVRRSQGRGKAIHDTGRRERPWTCSDHPLLLKKNLIFSQFCWLKQICQNIDHFDRNMNEMTNDTTIFNKEDTKKSVLNDAATIIKDRSRSDLLK